MRFLHNTILFVLFLGFIFSSCDKEDEPSSTPRTILIYMIATNSLGSYGFDEKDISEMDYAVGKADMNNCKVMLYYSSYGNDPMLINISKTSSGVEHKIIKTYSRSTKSVDPVRMKEVFKDVRENAQADDYGLVLWSHSDGWARTLSNNRNKNALKYLTRDFGDDSGQKMPIDVLAETLPDGMFSFVYSDVCYMGGVEVAYQFRNKIKYFIGSPTLLPANGMPYDKNLPLLAKNVPDLKYVCKNTYEYYNAIYGVERTLTISLVDCSKLDDLANVCHDIYPASVDINIDPEEIQRYMAPSLGKCIYYDFGQYFMKLANPAQRAILSDCLDKAVVYKACTPSIFGEFNIDSENFSGLSTYIMNTGNVVNQEYYTTLDWYKRVIAQ